MSNKHDLDLLTPEGMDAIAEQYERTMSSKIKAEINRERKEILKKNLHQLRNFAATEKNADIILYLITTLEKEFKI